jgi:hypothetical protein
MGNKIPIQSSMSQKAAHNQPPITSQQQGENKTHPLHNGQALQHTQIAKTSTKHTTDTLTPSEPKRQSQIQEAATHVMVSNQTSGTIKTKTNITKAA